MKYLALPFVVGNLEYSLCPWTGDLLSFESICNKKQLTKNLPEKIKSALSHCDFPYSLKRWDEGLSSKPQQLNRAKITKVILSFFCRLNFLIARKYSSLRYKQFPDSFSAINFFYSITEKDEVDQLCLPKALFAAKTSDAFNEHGVVFIGAFLPSRSMHAWIIEKGTQPDIRDDIWHQYRPIAVIY